MRVSGTPDWIRTSGLVSRSHTRYPTAPRAHITYNLEFTPRADNSMLIFKYVRSIADKI